MRHIIGHTGRLRAVLRTWIATAAVMAVTLTAAATAEGRTKWLCGPGVEGDPCRAKLSATRYDGWETPVDRFTAGHARDRGVDCFYVYPTVSDQPTRLANRRVDPEIRSIALYQAAWFSRACRVYAPLYRQATVPALQAGTTDRHDYLTAYGDVERAFGAFLRRIGRHRAFVLIGHSQGSYHLQRLIRRRIDDRPALRRRLVSAVLLGGDVTVRKGSDRGGVFDHIPTCRRASQLRCVIAFSTFSETPPDDAIFGRGGARGADFLDLPRGGKLETACTNPASLRRNRARPLVSVVPTEPFAPGTLIAAGISLLGLDWPAPPTNFVESEGAFRGRCSRAGGAHVLRVTAAPGTPVPNASPSPQWGLHLADANIAQEDLAGIVRHQIRTYARKGG
jgi:hypothetical protein